MTLVKTKPLFEIIAATRRSCIEASACPQGLGTALGPEEGTFGHRGEAARSCRGPWSVPAPAWRARGQHIQESLLKDKTGQEATEGFALGGGSGGPHPLSSTP